MSLPPLLLIPSRSFETGKRRLAAHLDPVSRRALIRELLDKLVHEAAQWPGLENTVVLSPCREVLAHARAAGAVALSQPPFDHLGEADSHTLNAALSLACEQLQRPARGDLLVVSADLPWVSAQDLRDLAAFSREGPGPRPVVVATDLAGTGTNALVLPQGVELPFCFGPDSARRHERAAASDQPVRCVRLPGLAFDLDTPEDLDTWQRTERGLAWA